MIRKTIKDTNLEQIAQSGQCFRMKRESENTYSLVAFGKYLEITQEGTDFIFSCAEEEFLRIWEEYLDLHTDYGKIKASVDSCDKYLSNAVSEGWGIRILKQDLWEIIVTFLISQNNNISRIKKSIQLLCERLGEKRTSENGKLYFTFPDPETVMHAGMEELSALGLGYRDKYIYSAACAAVEGRLNLEKLRKDDYETAHAHLTEQYGIGRKVADCICLFGLYHIEAFPIDTHVRKILGKYYPEGFPYEKYEGYAGILQQYMFYYDLVCV